MARLVIAEGCSIATREYLRKNFGPSKQVPKLPVKPIGFPMLCSFLLFFFPLIYLFVFCLALLLDIKK